MAKVPEELLGNPNISIVLPTYNGSRWLAESIDSVVGQTERNWELIIVNDNSMDNTREIAEDYAARDRRIRIISNEINRKLPASLNIGFSQAQGNYFTWTSDDNLYKPNALETMRNWLDEHPEMDLVSFDMDIIDENGRKMSNLFYKIPPRRTIGLMQGCNIGAAFMYRREVVERIGGYDEDLFCAEDYDYWIRIALVGRIGYVDNVNVYKYRKNRSSISVTRRSQVREKTQIIQRKYLSAFIEKFHLGYWGSAKLIFLTELARFDGNFIKYYPVFVILWLYRKAVQILSYSIFFSRPLRHKFRKLVALSMAHGEDGR
jgi:glycosyltransferase involved in cell wall biosynthesis